MDSKIYVRSKKSNNRTICDDLYATSPYKVLTLNNENDLDIVLMSSSAGLLKGDKVDMNFEFKSGSCQRLLTQSYEKVFDSDGGKVLKHLSMTVEAEAIVKYLPYPTILFNGSNYESVAEAKISSKSTLYYSDIFSCGRVHMGELFKLKEFRSRFKVYVDGALGFADNSYLLPSVYDYKCLGNWHNFTHNGLMYIHLPDEQKSENFIKKSRELGALLIDAEVGVSMARCGIVVRVLAKSGDTIYRYFQDII